MTDESPKTLVEQIQQHFANNGWQPLLQMKVNSLRALNDDKLHTVWLKVAASQDRMSAVTEILEAIIPGMTMKRPEDAPDLSDSAILRLRRQS